MIRLKRAYDPPSQDDGIRILVDRLWPRGVSKEHAAVGSWLKDIAPSAELRKWFGHDPAKWTEFERRYRKELKAHGAALEELRRQGSEQTVTLVYGAHDPDHNQAVVLKKVLENDQEIVGVRLIDSD